MRGVFTTMKEYRNVVNETVQERVGFVVPGLGDFMVHPCTYHVPYRPVAAYFDVALLHDCGYNWRRCAGMCGQCVAILHEKVPPARAQ